MSKEPNTKTVVLKKPETYFTQIKCDDCDLKFKTENDERSTMNLYPGFLPGHIQISVQLYCISLTLLSLIYCINNDNIAAKKSKSAWEEILGNSLCCSMPAEKLGLVEFLFDLILHVESFIVLGT